MTIRSTEIKTGSLPRPTNIGASMSRMTTEDLHEALGHALPVSRGSVMVDWEDAWMGSPTTTPDECRMAGTTYDAPIYVKLRIMSYDNDMLAETSTFKVRMGRVPIPDDRGLMILNGKDRVVVGKLAHSPGMLIRRVGERPYVRHHARKGHPPGSWRWIAEARSMLPSAEQRSPSRCYWPALGIPWTP